MDNNLTDITVVMDRSGSMMSCRDDAEGGFNSFVEQQKKEPGKALLTLVQFDTQYEFVHQGKPIEEVGKFTLVPRGGTALLDAVGRAINETGARLDKMPEHEKPGLVIVVIITDGHENSSKEFTKDTVRRLIEQQQNIYNWQFTYLGANQNAFAEAGKMGIRLEGVMNYSPAKVGLGYQATSSKVARMRASALSGQAVHNCFTEQERTSAV